MAKQTERERIRHLVRTQGPTRIAAYREYEHRRCVSDYRARRSPRRAGLRIDKIRFRVGSVVRSKYTEWTSLWLVVGHGYTGGRGTERGCMACKITDRVFKKWQWIGPESYVELAEL